MKIAVIGTGISGLVSAWLLNKEHDLVIYEAGDYIGGHTNTRDVSDGESQHAVDTGFIVFNDWTYPNFIKIIEKLGVESQLSSMSFSVKCERSGLEYNGTSLDTLFAQRRNLLKPSFHRMIRDIVRFNGDSVKLLSKNGATDRMSLADYMEQRNYSSEFIEHYLIPIGASIWSANPKGFAEIPAKFFIQFLNNHGMLSINDRPTWRTIKGGSRKYVEKIVEGFREKIRLNTPVTNIRREGGQVIIRDGQGGEETFDRAILACHSDQALRMISDPDVAERDILGAMPYVGNKTALHTHSAVLPKTRKAWAAWNYHIPPKDRDEVAITYDMNILQSIKAKQEFCVTLNKPAEIPADRILYETRYEHPVFTLDSVNAQKRWSEIDGQNGLHFCGAYWFYGFHEDGVRSALRVCEKFGATIDHV